MLEVHPLLLVNPNKKELHPPQKQLLLKPILRMVPYHQSSAKLLGSVSMLLPRISTFTVIV